MTRVSLFAMPDTISALDPLFRIPNLGLCSIAGNLDDSEVTVIDLVFRNRGICRRLEQMLPRLNPDVVGISAMSLQYESARRTAAVCRRVLPNVPIVLGGYHASLMYEEIGSGGDAWLFDFLIRGEGEVTFNRLLQALGGGEALTDIPGLSYKDEGQFVHNQIPSLLDLKTLKLPSRECRLVDDSRFLNLKLDCVETSRGCTMGCRFCSISQMYGHCIRLFPLERVIEDLKTVKSRGAQGVFFVDDNITLKISRLMELCKLIINEGLDDMAYLIQAGVRGIAEDPELAPLLRRAGFRWVFLGIESGIHRNLKSMGKGGIIDNTEKAINLLQENDICVFGGFIVGNPDDGNKEVAATYRYALDLGVDHPIIQCLTPYPKTLTREELIRDGLVSNTDNFSKYNGFICNVRTRRLTTRQLTLLMLWNGIKLFFHPRYIAKSRFWRYHAKLWPALVMNNIRFITGAAWGKLFASRHRW